MLSVVQHCNFLFMPPTASERWVLVHHKFECNGGDIEEILHKKIASFSE